MLYYSHRFNVRQKQETVFEYFLNKNYLKRFFQENETIEIISNSSSPLMTEGENFDMILLDKESIITLQITILKVIFNEFIEIKIQLIEILDREEGTLDDDSDVTYFLKKYIGENFIYSIQLENQNDRIEISEKGFVEPCGIIQKLLFRVLGFYYQFKYKHIYKQIKNEIELLK